MPTKPKHYAVFILNENGSGVVKQFDTWQQAKAAYAAESAEGKAVYLYPQPMKSIGAGTTPIEAPAKTPVTFTAVQNTGEFAWPPHPPLPRPTAPGGVFDDVTARYNEWKDYCIQHPTHRECSIPGKPKFGTESLVCGLENDQERSTDGTMYPASRPKIMLANGIGGTFPSEEVWQPDEGTPFRKWYAPCEYPNGFREYKDFLATSFKEISIGSLSGSTVIAIIRPALMRATRKLMQYNGNVPSQILLEEGVLPRDVPEMERELEVNALREYVAGEPVFNTAFGDAAMSVFVLFPLKPLNDDLSDPLPPVTEPLNIVVTETGNSHEIGYRTADVFRSGFTTPSPNGPMNITYDPEGGIGQGTWDVTMASPTELTFTFTPSGDTPADARPPEGWAGVVVRGASPDPTNPFGGEFEGVDTTGVPPGLTHQGPWTNVYDAANILLESDFDNHYYTNGTGGYYAIAIPPTDCDPVDTLVNENATEPITYDAGCGEWTIGTLTYNVYADGTCGFYDVSLYSTYNEGVIGTCNGNTYSVDSSGTVTSEPIISGYEGEESYITIPTGDSVLSGTRVRPQYQAGGTGEWTPWNYTASGTLYGSDSSYNYYSDGAGYYTSEPISNPCDPADYHYSNNGPYDLMYDAGCGSVQIGIYYENTYADGNCGSYTIQDNSSTPGDFTTCNGNIYTVDSTGNVTSRPETICEDSNLHSGEAGWSYDGCNWSYSEPCPSSGTDLGVDPNNSCQNIYADGNCGTYTSDNGSCGGPSCDSSGTYLTSGSEPTYYNSDCGQMGNGWTDYTEYADGSCGAYRSYSSPTYLASGAYIGECGGYLYYSDGNGGAYTA